MNSYVERVLEIAKKKDGNQPEFLQALSEVLCSIAPIINMDDKYEKNAILERLIEPERVIMFRVPWVNDNGEVIEPLIDRIVGRYSATKVIDPNTKKTIFESGGIMCR